MKGYAFLLSQVLSLSLSLRFEASALLQHNPLQPTQRRCSLNKLKKNRPLRATPWDTNGENEDEGVMESMLAEFLEEADQDVRDEVISMQDQAMTEPPVMFYSDSDSESGFDFERWELHRSPNRYFRLLLGLFTGVTTRRIFPTVFLLGLWSAAVDVYNANEHVYSFPEVELPLTPFELAAPVLGLLLVFRSNTAFERFNAGSEAAWEITGSFRSVTRELLSFTSNASRYSPQERVAAYELVEACVLLHGWIMMDYLRTPEAKQSKQQTRLKICQKALALPESAARDSLGDQGLSGLLNTLSLGVATRIPSLDPQESTMIDAQFSEIIKSVGTCEKLLCTPIPLGYTRYSVRFTLIWLSLLPFALVNTFANFGTNTWWEDKPQPVVVVAMLFLSVIFLSIEDISVQIEEPFCILPLDLHQQWLKRDVKQMCKTSRIVDGMQLEQKTEDGTHLEQKKEATERRLRNRLKNRFKDGIRSKD